MAKIILASRVGWMNPEIEQLKREIEGDRSEIILEVTPRSLSEETDIQSFDAWMEKLSLFPLKQGWKTVNKKMAIAILRFILHRDLAYRTEMMNRWKAQQYSDRFLQYFDLRSRYYTNAEFAIEDSAGDIEVKKLRTWSPLTHATFDTGIIVCSPTHLGLLWVRDED